VTTAVVSDLHLGDPASVLGDAATRAALVEELRGADRVVLLGDVLALRRAPAKSILDAAAPFLAELGAACAGAEIVVVPGNHDHALAVDARLFAEVARLLAPARVTLAYPGVSVRNDVYAMHGHYLDCHVSVPRQEAIAAGRAQRRMGRIPARATVDDYERVLAPLYARWHAAAQEETTARPPRAAMRSLGWRALTSHNGGARSRSARVAVGAAVLALRATRVGRFGADLSAAEIGRACSAAFAEVVSRLELDAAWVVFGHSHCAGVDGALVNAGSWVCSPELLGGGDARRSGFWPGTVVRIGESGAPELVRLLETLPPLAIDLPPELAARA
jgi:predicted phosphodiesterase